MIFSDHIVRQLQLIPFAVCMTLASCCPAFGQEDLSSEIEVLRKKVYLYENEVIGEFTEGAEAQSEDEIDQSLISNYWIGVRCEKAGSSTFTPKATPGVELTIEGGMKILAVTELSAAKEAGLQENDVLLKFANKDISSLNDLYGVIGETEDNESELVLIRNGEFISLKITPKQRPEHSPQSSGELLPHIALATLDEAFKRELLGKRIPEGYRIKVELAPGEDIALTVEQGDDTFKANGDSVDQLPKAVQDIANELVAKCKPMIESKQDAMLLPLLTIDTSRLPELKGYQRTEAHINEKLAAIEKQLTEITKVTKVLQEELTKAPQELKSDLKK